MKEQGNLIHQLLEMHVAEGLKEKTCIIDGEENYTYQALQQACIGVQHYIESVN